MNICSSGVFLFIYLYNDNVVDVVYFFDKCRRWIISCKDNNWKKECKKNWG